jgi:Protein of unknown function (DUF2846)
MRTITMLCAVVLFAGVLFAEDQEAAARAAAGCGPSEAQFVVMKNKEQHPTTQPEPGKALVYVFDQPDNTSLEIGAMTTRWGLDGTWVGASDLKSYFYFSVDPGEHRLCTQRQSRFKSVSNVSTAITFNSEAGKAYYFRLRARRIKQENTNYVKLEALDPAEAQVMIANAAYSQSKPKK